MTKIKDDTWLIGLSATIPNLQEVSDWLKADIFQTDFRPNQVKEYVKLGDEIFDSNKNKIREI